MEKRSWHPGQRTWIGKLWYAAFGLWLMGTLYTTAPQAGRYFTSHQEGKTAAITTIRCAVRQLLTVGMINLHHSHADKCVVSPTLP